VATLKCGSCTWSDLRKTSDSGRSTQAPSGWISVRDVGEAVACQQPAHLSIRNRSQQDVIKYVPGGTMPEGRESFVDRAKALRIVETNPTR
jgi:hypothetical protein